MPKNAVLVELFYNGVWNDVTGNDEVFTDSPITIMQGQTDDDGLRPSQIMLRLNNASDKFRVTNPSSPLYRLVGRNTPIRITVGTSIRAVCEISSWKCDQSQDFRATPRRGKAWCDIVANGQLFRINTWTRTIPSAIKHYTLYNGIVTPYEYWSMEMPSGSTYAPSSFDGYPLTPLNAVDYTLPGAGSLPPGNPPAFGSGDRILGSSALPGFKEGGTLAGIVRTATYNGYAIDWFMQFEADSDEGGTTVADVLFWNESGTYTTFNVRVEKNKITVLHANASDWASLAFTGAAVATFDVYDGTAHHFRYQVRQSGGNYLAELYIDSANYATADNFIPGMTGTVGQPTYVQWNPGRVSGNFMPIAAGHLTVWPSGQIGGQPPVFFAINGFASEITSIRWDRILTAENINNNFIGNSAYAQVMGPMKEDTLFNHIKEIRDTEDGLVYDDNDALGVLFKLLNRRYNQSVSITLYPTDFPNLPLEITDNDDTHNVVTVTQRDGESYTAEDSTGFLGTQAPPNGIGEQKDDVAINIANPSQDLPRYANWWLKRGTVDLPRFPEVVLDLNASPHLIAAVSAMLVGSVIEIVGMRENTIRLYVLGWKEVIGTHGRTISFACKPDQQMLPGVWDAATSIWASATHFLKDTVSPIATSITLRSLSSKIVWGTTVPYDLFISGERVTVTSMGAASLVSGGYDQVATVSRGTNGIFKTLPSGSIIELATPGRWAL